MNCKCKFITIDADDNHIINEIHPDHYIEVYCNDSEESIYLRARTVDADLMSYSIISENGKIKSYVECPI
jgi:hypothetical protein